MNKKKIYLGSHVSISGGIENSVIKAYKLGATAFSIFVLNPFRWKVKKIKKKIIKKFKNNCKKYFFSNNQIFPHGSFLVNLGHPDKKKLNLCRKHCIREINQCLSLGLKYLNIHPGSHLNKISEFDCLKKIADSINFILKDINKFTLVLENTAGQGTNVGYKFEHLSYIIKNVIKKNQVGVCLDTCHLFASGYDLRTLKNCEKMFENFKKIIGLKYLKGFHLNDSKKNFFSRKDRHQNLGLGKIGLFPFSWIVKKKNFFRKPMILETPNKKFWNKEISWLFKNSEYL